MVLATEHGIDSTLQAKIGRVVKFKIANDKICVGPQDEMGKEDEQGTRSRRGGSGGEGNLKTGEMNEEERAPIILSLSALLSHDTYHLYL